MKKNKFIVMVLVLGMILAGCSSAVESDQNTNPVDEDKKVQVTDKYETVGEIMEFTTEGVHVITGDIVEIFKVAPEKTKNFYLGETVGVIKIKDNEFELEKFKIEDFSVRHTNMGELIEKVSGEIKNVSENKLTITTKDGDLDFESYGEIFLEKGTEITVEYLERTEGNILIDFYNEASKLNLIVKEIRRVEKTGEMVLDTEDKDGLKYEVYVLGRTVLNFNHSDLNIGDEITVYPELIREIYPTQVDAQMINRDISE
ncbi:hypothetical protein R9X47_08700 [Wukongibacter baidiensis]|uniref:hypothetical protein n=1 Tax=Wukongibacter baidiensis TaxID=1723361 RepID=UPI003D7F2265